MTSPLHDDFSIPHPGATPYTPELKSLLAARKTALGPAYQPRTRHLRPDGWAQYTNRLFLESSPYLLQHAHNPVDWRPWGDEAFAEAACAHRPVFMSVGYATCHWCHVMEEESFEDEKIAGFLNAHYICVKVDREERPDIDSMYMKAVQALTGQGGWPMSVWLTPDRLPFYGGTYFPARDGERGAMMGFLTLLSRLLEAYHAPDGRAVEAARQVKDAISRMAAPPAGGPLPGRTVLDRAARFYREHYDPMHGGLLGAPKFPSSLPIRFLLRYHARTGEADILDMAAHTLRRMAGGGIYDQAGGGFHRYATDESWLVPHFEKMLYDNALLAKAYLEAFQATGDAFFRAVAVDILRYADRDMSAPEGGFYAATDADSPTPDGHRAEGYYFTWTPLEIEALLGRDRARLVMAHYNMGQTPNFEGRHILHAPKTADETARFLGMDEAAFHAELMACRELLYQARRKRPAPLRDEKILTSWNGLMISAFATAGRVLGDPAHTARAIRAARFLLGCLVQEGRLFRCYMDGKARHNGLLEDAAFLAGALLDLYAASGDGEWLRQAVMVDGLLETDYEDVENGGFFMTPSHHEPLIAREKPFQDNALPSGNAAAAMVLLRLYEATGDNRYLARAEKTFRAFGQVLADTPWAAADLLRAVDRYLDQGLFGNPG